MSTFSEVCDNYDAYKTAGPAYVPADRVECPECHTDDVGNLETCKIVGCGKKACEVCWDAHQEKCLTCWAEIGGHIDDCAGWAGEACDCAARMRDEEAE